MPSYDKKFEAETGQRDRKRTQYMRLRLASVMRVDWAKWTVDVQYLQETGGRTNVYTATAYWSGNAYMGAMPQVGDNVIIGFWHAGTDGWVPVILGYLPRGLHAARRGESQYSGIPPVDDDDSRNQTTTITRGRLRKILPGQILLQSSEGSDLVLSDDVLLSNSTGNEFKLRSDDQTAVLNSIGTVINGSGYEYKLGPITRNHLVLDDHVYQDGDGPVDATDYEAALAARFIRPVVLPNGKKVHYVCSLPLSPDEGGLPYTEARKEILEHSPLSMRHTEDTELFAEYVKTTAPIVEHVQGTVVGDRPSDPTTYGRPLKPRIFSALTQPTGTYTWDEAVGPQGAIREDNLSTEAGADYLRVGQFRRAITKTGNIYIDVPRSTVGAPLGDGHSVHASLQGALKMAVGAEGSINNSIYLTTQGSLKGVIGPGSDRAERGEKNRSLDMVLRGGANIEYKGVDTEGVSLRQMLEGQEYKEVGRNSTTEIKGSDTLLVHGAKTVKVLGKLSQQVTGNWHNTIGGDVQNTVTGKVTEAIGGERDVVIATPGKGINADTLTIVAGGRAATLTIGNDMTTITAGNMIDTIVAGNKITTIQAGSYTVAVTAGAVTIATAVGAITMTTAAGVMALTATGLVQITGGIVNVTGALVNLGPSPSAGVVTTAHPCLVTGQAHPGSFTVLATP